MFELDTDVAAAKALVSPYPVFWGGLGMEAAREAIETRDAAAVVLYGDQFVLVSRIDDDRYSRTTGGGCDVAGPGYGVWWLNRPISYPKALLQLLDRLEVRHLPEVVGALHTWAFRLEQQITDPTQEWGVAAFESRVCAIAQLRGEPVPTCPEVETGRLILFQTLETVFDPDDYTWLRRVVEGRVVGICTTGRLEVEWSKYCYDEIEERFRKTLVETIISPLQIKEVRRNG